MAAGPGFPVLSAAVLVDFGRARAGDPRVRPLTILLAGTAAADTVQLREGLEEAGHRCLLAADWAEAMGTVSRIPIDVMVQDLACPGARRFDAVKRLRGWPPPISRLLVVALAGEREPRLEAACLEAGFDAMISRPVHAEVLEAALRRLVVAHSPAEPLDAARRAALLEEFGPEARRARDEAALDAAAASIADIRSLPALPDVQAAAARAAEAFTSVGAITAAAAARAIEAEPDRRPVLLQPLVSAAVAAKMALRRG
ncbi:response regulator [Belnapia sp. F-4-1]|uniref:response regulator n=1 Tax=Belnapia sp. F-4-1 TaxID=1545443 RepID=UPI0005B881CE|nr:response regulator [Belnapia sp. F-4-1]